MLKVSRFPAQMRRVPMLAIALGAAFTVQGCANGLPRLIAPKPQTADQVVVTEPAPSPTQASVSTSTRKATPPVTRTTPIVPATAPLALNVLYYVRVMVPVGSELTIRADSAAGGAPSIKTIKTAGGPPYAVEIPVSAAADAYPMTIDATLQSTIGHVLAGSVTLDAKPNKPVEIVMDPKAE